VRSFYAWLRGHPLVVDSLLAAAVALLGLIAIGAGHVRLVVELPFIVAMSAPVALRRRYPVGAFAAVVVVGGLEVLWLPRPFGSDLAVIVLLYTVAAYRPRRISVLALVVCLTGSLVAILVWGAHVVHSAWAFAGVAAVFAGPALLAWLLGDSMQWRRGYYRGLEERAARAERERDARAQIAVAAERARIARELHDVVAHHVSVMVVQADGAAFALEASPEKAGQALTAISRTGRQALAEMRRLLGVLRSADDEGGQLEPQPGVEQLAGLLEQAGELLHARLRFELAALVVGRTQHAEQPAHLRERLPSGAGDRGQRLPRLLRRRLERERGPIGLYHHHAHVVRDDVVQFAGDPGALGGDRDLSPRVALAFGPRGPFLEPPVVAAPPLHRVPEQPRQQRRAGEHRRDAGERPRRMNDVRSPHQDGHQRPGQADDQGKDRDPARPVGGDCIKQHDDCQVRAERPGQPQHLEAADHHHGGERADRVPPPQRHRGGHRHDERQLYHQPDVPRADRDQPEQRHCGGEQAVHHQRMAAQPGVERAHPISVRRGPAARRPPTGRFSYATCYVARRTLYCPARLRAALARPLPSSLFPRRSGASRHRSSVIRRGGPLARGRILRRLDTWWREASPPTRPRRPA